MALHIVYEDTSSDLNTLLQKDSSVTIHQWHLLLLMTEIYRKKSGLNPCFMNTVFVQKSTQYNLRVNNQLDLPRFKTVTYCIQSAAFPSSSLWNTVPNEIKNSRRISILKNVTNLEREERHPCRLCKQYLA